MGEGAEGAVRYALALDVRGRSVVVVGGGGVAERKVRGLLEAGAVVSVIAPRATGELQALAERGALTLHKREFRSSDVAGARLVFAATGNQSVDAAAIAAGRAAGAFCNDASDGRRGDFITPMVHRSGPITFSVDTGGTSPSFARRLRDDLRERFGDRYGAAAAVLGRARRYAMTILAPGERAQVMDALASRDVDELAAIEPGSIEHEVDRAAAAVRGENRRDPSAPLVCATRKSALALVQAREAMARIAVAGLASELLPLSTTGDRRQDVPIEALGSENVFVGELEAALRDGRADYAVHSCKDLPSALPGDMCLAAVGVRVDARDAFISEHHARFETLPARARVGTSSPRRRAQLAALRPDLEYVTLRGNVETRLRKLREGECDAIVLAAAGLQRLGTGAAHVVPFEPAALLPAAGQGALALEVRAADAALAARLHAAFADPATQRAVLAERAFLRAVRGGCRAPVGAYAAFAGSSLRLQGLIAAADGSRIVRGEAAVEPGDDAEAERLGEDLGRRLLAEGGEDLLDRATAGPLAGVLFLLPRTQERPSRIAQALRAGGGEVVEAAAGEDALRALETRRPDVLLVPSSGAVRAIAGYLDELRALGVRPLVAAMGPVSAEAVAAAGFPPDVVAPQAEIGAFVQSVTRAVLNNAS